MNIGVEARRVEDVEAFIEALEAQTPFRDVLPVEEQTGDDGLIEAVLDGHYAPERPGAAATGRRGQRRRKAGGAMSAPHTARSRAASSRRTASR